MQELWRSSFGSRRDPPGLPRPLAYLPGPRALVMERLDGRPLAELGPPREHRVRDAIRLLAELHGSDARPRRRRETRRVVRALREKAAATTAVASPYARILAEAVEAVAVEDPGDGPLVPSHGDFSARNVLVGPRRLAVIDWDRFQAADPARDVVHFGTSSWANALRRGERPSWAPLEWAVEEYERVTHYVFDQRALRFNVAAGLLRSAFSFVHLWPAQAALVPVVTAEALRRLG
jgi:aminoglycoside phosphotransferase (APT) family kinase protein